MKLLRVLPFSKYLLSETIEADETVVDATAGNGNDTLFLAEHVGEKGHVFAFDIQQAALDSTAERLGELNERVSLILDSHDNVEQYVTGPIGGAVFNLGYLPYSNDLSIVTKPETTIKAIHMLLGLLKKGGIIAISVYDGHEGGKEERDALLSYVKTLHQADVHVIRYELLNQRNNPPFLIALEKMRDFEMVKQVD
ncbi:methyltransferase domain-containing protein [Sporosarcina sp. ACRSM]|uniref:class I SAM-dependent methyltransferase n=1 Tax=Sporosarcina sp. ACRSM TaxID=2918216 RepID=UPI001EF3FF2D|nr:class I SAM-dependent methyltransferase [Sporosarcina sp. ACRSM]MCG7335572.1 methyltransferase domain-containing protein [Sporosarcina sp. ACRSM]